MVLLEDQKLVLIEFIRDHLPAVYDPTDVDYLKPNKHDIIWTTVAEKLNPEFNAKLNGNLEPWEYRHEWTLLRQGFHNNLRKIREQKARGNDNFMPSWSFFKHLTFLEPFYRERERGPYLPTTSSNVSHQMDHPQSDSVSSWIPPPMDDSNPERQGEDEEDVVPLDAHAGIAVDQKGPSPIDFVAGKSSPCQQQPSSSGLHKSRKRQQRESSSDNLAVAQSSAQSPISAMSDSLPGLAEHYTETSVWRFKYQKLLYEHEQTRKELEDTRRERDRLKELLKRTVQLL